MMQPELYKNPVVLSHERHGHLKMDMNTLVDWARVATIPSCFVQAAEFADVCLDYPIVFLPMEGGAEDAKPEVGPVAVLGLGPNENLFVENGRWRGSYLPAQFRAWPFAAVPGHNGAYTALIDESCPGLNTEKGTPLFEADGQPGAYLREAVQFAEKVFRETPRTRALCARLLELQLLERKRFSAGEAPNEIVSVSGFLTLEAEKVAALSDADVLDLHRTGLLGLLHAHHLSLGHTSRLVKWHTVRRANS